MSVATSTAIGLGVAAASSAGAGIYAANKSGEAADKQQASNQQALDFAKERYAQLQRNEAPYQQAGVGATAGIGSLLNRAAVSKGYAAPLTPSLVMLRAPDGSTKQVPSDQVGHYVQLGAQQVS